MFTKCFFILLMGGLVTPLSISNKLQDLQSIGGGSMISWEPRTMISSEDYPCAVEGLYEHPVNCSRFYRCVDFTKESRIFSRYLFECPVEMVFAKTIQACVPGVCPEKAAKLPSEEGGETAGADTASIMIPVGSGIAGGMSELPGAGSTGGSGTEGGSPSSVGSSTVETATPAASGSTGEAIPSGLPPVIDQDESVVSIGEVPESMENCPGRYVQHVRFCNLFHLCEDPKKLFSCHNATAFSSERQMCRLYKFDNIKNPPSSVNHDIQLCQGREEFVASAELFREAFQWNEVGVIHLDKTPVFNSNPYVFTNMGDIPEGFTKTNYKTELPSQVIQVPREDPKEKKKSRFSSLLGTFSSLLSDGKRRSSNRKSQNRKTSVPKVAKKEKPSTSQKENTLNLDDFDFSSFLPYASLLGNSLSGIASVLGPSQKDSIATSPLSSEDFLRQFSNAQNPLGSAGFLGQLSNSANPLSSAGFLGQLSSSSNPLSSAGYLGQLSGSANPLSSAGYLGQLSGSANPLSSAGYLGQLSGSANPLSSAGYLGQLSGSANPLSSAGYLGQLSSSSNPLSSAGYLGQLSGSANPLSSAGFLSQLSSSANPLTSADFLSQLSSSSNPLSSTGFISPLTSSSASFSPLKSFDQSESQYPGQGYQLAYVVSPSSFGYSPYAGFYPYSFGSSDPTSFVRAQLAPTRTYSQFQGYPFTSSSGSFNPYSQYFASPSSSSGFSSPYAFVYDPTRNSISPIPIPSSYLSSIYGSLLGMNPYESLLQMDDQKDSEELSISPTVTDVKPAKGSNRLKAKEPEMTSFQSEIAKKYPFLFNTQVPTQDKPTSPFTSAFEARNKEGDTYQVIPLSGDEVATLASQGLLERAVTVGKDFSYDDLKNLNKGEIILATFPKK